MAHDARYDSPVKCDKCDNEATVHEVNIKGGKRHEKHLCEKCARDQGVSIVHAGPSVEHLLETFIALKPDASITPTPGGEAGSSAKAASGAPPACSACGRTFAQFRSTGVLGCPQCYSVFENQLGPLLSRAHEGGTHHVGKTPRSMASSVAGAVPVACRDAPDLERRLALLRVSLDEAVAGEQYEKAAKIRDELQRVQARAAGDLQAPAPEDGATDAGSRAPSRRRTREEPS